MIEKENVTDTVFGLLHSPGRQRVTRVALVFMPTVIENIINLNKLCSALA